MMMSLRLEDRMCVLMLCSHHRGQNNEAVLFLKGVDVMMEND